MASIKISLPRTGGFSFKTDFWGATDWFGSNLHWTYCLTFWTWEQLIPGDTLPRSALKRLT